MGGRGSWLVGIAVAALAAAAVADALRGEGETSAASERPPATMAGAARPVVAGTPAGVLFYTDETCRLRAARLPSLDPVAVPAWRDCPFVLSPDATSVSEVPSGWDPVGDFLFTVRRGRVVVTSGHEPVGGPFPARDAAWRPDGTLTYVDGGTVRAWPGGRVLLSQDDLAQAVLAHPDVPDNGHVLPVAAREVGWLDERRSVVILDGVVTGPRQSLLGFFDGAKLTAMHFGGDTRLSDLRVSPRGGFVAVRSGGSFLLLNARGDVLPAPLGGGDRAIAWSPDERWTAVATDRGIAVARTGETSEDVLLPIVARDLAWRGGFGSR